MAIAETARLFASLGWKDNLSPGVDKTVRNVDKLQGRLATAGRGAGFFGHAISTALGVGLERVASAGIRTLTSAISDGVAGAEQLQQIQTATAQVLRTTGGVAGQTAESISNLSHKYEDLNALIDDKVIQSGENLLLTFTNIRSKAFEPALEAALNLNQAMGGGESGLQGTIIQIGKALNDPIKGLTALRRVGVSFDAQQIKRIKTLQEHNKLYEAQQIILQELSKEFGGQFAAAGKTAAGQAANLRDAVDDLKIAFAQGLLPGLENVRSALTATFRDPATIAAVRDFGNQIGSFLSPENIQAGIGLVKEGFAALKQIPWDAIRQAMTITGQSAKIVFDTFTGLPDWVKTAVLTGWGLNKLTGGFLGDVTSALASGLIKGVLSMNAGVVNVNAATVVGAGPGGAVGAVEEGAVAAAGGIGLGTIAAIGTIAASIAAIGITLKLQNDARSQDAADLKATFEKNLPGMTLDQMKTSLDAVNKGISDIQSNPLNVLVQGDALDQLKQMKAQLEARVNPGGPGSPVPGAPGAGNPRLAGFAARAGAPSAGGRDTDKELRSANDTLAAIKADGIDLKQIAASRLAYLAEAVKHLQAPLKSYGHELRTRLSELKHELAKKKPASEGSRLIAARIEGVRAKQRDVQAGIKALQNSQDPKLTKLDTRLAVDGDRLRSLNQRLHIAKESGDKARARVLQGKINTTNRDIDATRTQVARQVASSGADMTRAGYAAAQAAQTAGYTTARAQDAAASRIVAAIYANRPIIQPTNAQRSSTTQGRAGPTGGSRNTPRAENGHAGDGGP